MPRGNPDGGQWTRVGGGRVLPASSRPRGTSLVRVGGRFLEATPAQQVRLAVSAARANADVRAVREIDPNWRPTPSLYETVEGAIAANEMMAREAEARLSALGWQASPALPLRDLLAPGGQAIGFRSRGAGVEIRTVTKSEFDYLLARLMEGAQFVPPPSDTFRGQWYMRRDGTIFSVRVSLRHGVTIEIIKSSDALVSPPVKVHQK